MDQLLQHNKQNTMKASNQSDAESQFSSSFCSAQHSSRKNESQSKRYHFLQDLKRQNYQQQKKNKKIFDQVKQINKYFGYRLMQRSMHDYRQANILKQYETLLQQECYLLKQLAKAQCIQHQNNPFRFLIDVWGKQIVNDTSQQRIEKMNKNLIFVKNNIIRLTNQAQSQVSQNFSSFIFQSKEYCELKKNYLAALNQIQILKQQNSMKQSLNKQQKQQFQKINKQLVSQQLKLSAKVTQYEGKSKQLIRQIVQLSNQLQKQKMRNQQQYLQNVLLNQSNISSINPNNISMVSQDQKENVLSQLIDLQQQMATLNSISMTSNKKKKGTTQRNTIFSGCKRMLFPANEAQRQKIQQKSMRFIRRQ